MIKQLKQNEILLNTKKDRMMQEEWLKKNKPTTCSIAQNFNVPTEIPEVYDDDNS
jgi:hypothetical protein